MARTKAEARKAIVEGGKDGKSSTKAGKKSSKDVKVKLEIPSGNATSLSPDERGAAERGQPRNGIKAMQEIRFYQGNTELLIRKLPFQKLVRELCAKIGPFRFEVQALLALQEAAEMFITGAFEDASLCALHGRRVTVMPRDLLLSRRIHGAGAEDRS
ncbi:unnamed protein product, partial [Polarella glacialis]